MVTRLKRGAPTGRMGNTPITPEALAERRATLLRVALSMMLTYGYGSPLITRDTVAEKAEMSAGLVNRYFGTFAELKREVMQEAIEQQHLVLIAQGIAHHDVVALAAPADLRSQALAMVGGDL